MDSKDNARTVADRLAAELDLYDGISARAWHPSQDGVPSRVYLTRSLSRGRHQDIGFLTVEIREDGAIVLESNGLTRSRAGWRESAREEVEAMGLRVIA